MRCKVATAVLSCAALVAPCAWAQEPVILADHTRLAPSSNARSDTLSASNPPLVNYVLGPRDTLLIHILHMDELGNNLYPIDLEGYLNLPRIGRVRAAGLTVDQLEEELSKRAKEYLQNPVVNVTVAEFHSQPVSVLGAVANPGVHQVQGNKTLYEVISEAGGLKEDAGNTIKITRRIEEGAIPLPNAIIDPSGRFSIAQLNVRSVMSARNPLENIATKPNDVITVPRADLI
jgi:polysaccharide biosynthesis/export protein